MSGATVVISPAGYSSGGVTPTFDYYISPTGSDANVGTLASPWAITAINTKRATYAGKSVGLLDGTYDLSAASSFDGGSSYLAYSIASGAPGAPTVIQAVNARQAILSLKSGSTRNQNAALGLGGVSGQIGYATIKNLVITGGGNSSIRYIPPSVGYHLGLRVEGCEIYDQLLPVQDNCPAIAASACDGLIVFNNKFHDLYLTGSSEGACALLTFGCKNIQFEQNTVYNTLCGIYDKHNIGGRTDPNQGMTVARNYFHDIALTTFHGFDNQYAAQVTGGPFLPHTIRNNVAHAIKGWIYPQISEPANAANVHYNNTIILSSAASGGVALPCASTSAKQSFYNNIIQRSSTTGDSGDVTFSVGGMSVVDFNCYSSDRITAQIASPIGTYDGTTTFTAYTTLSSWQSASGKDANSQQAVAGFVGGSGAGAYALAAGSPCLNAGRVGGVSGGATCHQGAWDGSVSQIGCDF